MTKYKIHVIRERGRFMGKVVELNAKLFVPIKGGVEIQGRGYKRIINNSWYADIDTDQL